GLVLGYILTGLGLATLNASTRGLALAATGTYGLGYGLVTPPTNLSAAEAGGKNSAGMVSLLNFAWGIGAFGCSPLIMLALRRQVLSPLLWTLGIIALLLAALFLVVSFPAERQARTASGAPSSAVPGPSVTIMITALFFLYVGTELGIGGWAAEHTKRLARYATSFSTIAPMFFYGGIMTGRAVATLVLARVPESAVIAGALSLTI